MNTLLQDYADGHAERRPDATAIDTLPEDGVRQFRAGIDWSSEQDAPFEIYMDDIVLDTAPVACR